jgi:hypothetical protein
MRKVTILVLIALSTTGCASVPAPAIYGNFVQGPVPANDKAMADDAANKLAALYPPARTRFNLLQATPDAFGVSLVAALRMKGYALAEFTPTPAAPSDAQGAAAAATTGQAGDATLAYVVDQPLDASLYRVTVLVNNQPLSRLYGAKDSAIAPAGYWVRKE